MRKSFTVETFLNPLLPFWALKSVAKSCVQTNALPAGRTNPAGRDKAEATTWLEAATAPAPAHMRVSVLTCAHSGHLRAQQAEGRTRGVKAAEATPLKTSGRHSSEPLFIPTPERTFWFPELSLRSEPGFLHTPSVTNFLMDCLLSYEVLKSLQWNLHPAKITSHPAPHPQAFFSGQLVGF